MRSRASLPGRALRRLLGHGLRLEQFVQASLQRRQIACNAPGHLLSMRAQFDPGHQFRRGLEAQRDVRPEGLMNCGLYGRALRRGQIECAAHGRWLDSGPEGLGQALLGAAIDGAQTPDELVAHTLFQSGIGQIGQGLARDREHFVLGAMGDGLVQVQGLGSKRLLALGIEVRGRLPRRVCTDSR